MSIKKYLCYRVIQFVCLMLYRALQIVLIWWAINNFHSNLIASSIVILPAIFRLLGLALAGNVIRRYAVRKLITNINFICGCLGLLAALLFIYREVSLLIVLIISLISFVLTLLSPLDKLITCSIKNKSALDVLISLQFSLDMAAYLVAAVIAGVFMTSLNMATLLYIFVIVYFFSAILNWFLVPSLKLGSGTENPSTVLPSLSSIRLLYNIKTEFYLSVTSMLANTLIFSFFNFLLPVLVNKIFNLDARYYASCEIIVCIGCFLGLGIIGLLKLIKIKSDHLVYGSLFVSAISFIIISQLSSSTYLYPALLVLAIGIITFNSATTSKRLLAIPDKNRADLFSLIYLLNESLVPVGLFVVSQLSATLSIQSLLLLSGLILFSIILFVPAIPHFKQLMRASEKSVENLYQKLYPKQFNTQRKGDL